MKLNDGAIAFLIVLQIVEIVPAKILVITAMCTGSEENFFAPIIGGLAKRGHHVTSVTSKISKNVPGNVTQLQPLDYNELFGEYDNPFQMAENNEDLAILFYDIGFFTNYCTKVYENEEFQRKVLNVKFDLILSTAMFHQCFYGLVPKNQANLVLLSALPPPNYLLRGLGTHFPPSFIPYPTLPYTEQMTFFQKIYNFVVDITLELLWEFIYLDQMEAVYLKHLPGAENYPGIREIKQNVSLFLSNSFFTMNFPRPLLPDVIEVGGVHCGPPNPLPPDFEKFVSEAPEGFIYFSMGSIAKGSKLPIQIRNMFTRVFSKLKQRVLWKWESEDGIPDLPKNVKLSKWFSQTDVLGHKNIRLFITHGGLFSTQEALYNGVPLIGVPVYFDQFTNVKQAVKHGYAINLDIYNLKEQDLEYAINEILTKATYKERAAYMSHVFRDQKETPLERALYWIEYVIRHKGAPHLKSEARNLSWFQYHLLDIILCLAVTLCAVLATLFFLFRYLFASLFLFSTKEITAKRVSRDRKRK